MCPMVPLASSPVKVAFGFQSVPPAISRAPPISAALVIAGLGSVLLRLRYHLRTTAAAPVTTGAAQLVPAEKPYWTYGLAQYVVLSRGVLQKRGGGVPFCGTVAHGRGRRSL